ncbi:3156_t:CDS:1, partial [Dentiscutata erythropus]
AVSIDLKRRNLRESCTSDFDCTTNICRTVDRDGNKCQLSCTYKELILVLLKTLHTKATAVLVLFLIKMDGRNYDTPGRCATDSETVTIV